MNDGDIRRRSSLDLHKGMPGDRQVVELVWRYSNRADQLKRIRRTRAFLGKRWPTRPGTTVPRPQKLARRRDAETVGTLVAAYEAGATDRDLSDRYDLARSTVIELLRQQDVAIRHPRVSPAEIGQAVDWYREGVRQIDIAKRLGRHKSVVWHLLRRAGAI